MTLWTDPQAHIWAALEQVQASNMDTYIKDNLRALTSSAQVLDTGAAIVGTIGAVTTTPLLKLQPVSNVYAYATGGVAITFPTPFPNSLLTILVNGGDDDGSLVQTQMIGVGTLSGFIVAAFTNLGVEVTNGVNVRINYLAIGT